MEKMPDTILDIMRLDAITKLKNSNLRTKEEQNKVIGAAKDIMKLADLARKEGLLALEAMAETLPSDFLRQLILLVVDGNFPDTIAEIGTNVYWTKAPDGAVVLRQYYIKILHNAALIAFSLSWIYLIRPTVFRTSRIPMCCSASSAHAPSAL